ncbi:MAG TPA: electron transfer flavoprotein-ubiquinone oxidoreductase, partial [Gammaproteobacteria bacterium]|nr:electron transfer flavoprotein-ubiquinone oxidoreductase [Gammaproteobacteria bacterium]
MERESMEVDVVVVGAGPAGLATACRLMQLAAENEHELSVVVLEKAAAVGDHILSGAVIEPTALNEL